MKKLTKLLLTGMLCFMSCPLTLQAVKAEDRRTVTIPSALVMEDDNSFFNNCSEVQDMILNKAIIDEDGNFRMHLSNDDIDRAEKALVQEMHKIAIDVAIKSGGSIVVRGTISKIIFAVYTDDFNLDVIDQDMVDLARLFLAFKAMSGIPASQIDLTASFVKPHSGEEVGSLHLRDILASRSRFSNFLGDE